MANATPITLSSAKFQDLAVSGINTKLVQRLAWLNMYGVAVKLVGEQGFYPAFETLSNDTLNYQSLWPDTQLGNFGFWDVADGASIEKKGDFIHLRFLAGLVIWGDLRTVYTGNAWKSKNTKNVASDVAAALQLQNFGSSRLQFSKMYFEASNIYKTYNHGEVKNQFLKRPYFGLRIDCDIVSQQKCP
jgi:hypothetical protein